MSIPKADKFIRTSIWLIAISFAIIQVSTRFSEKKEFFTQLLYLKNTTSQNCPNFFIEHFDNLNDQQRSTISGLFITLGCIDLADQIIPKNPKYINRKELFAYQIGQIAWENDNPEKAIYYWKKGKGINFFLWQKAYNIKKNNIEQSIIFYDASIRSTQNFRDLAIILTYFTEDLRADIDPKIFVDQLEKLSSYFNYNTPIGYRLRGQARQMKGDYKSAFHLLTLAIDGGFNDSETWYYLGEAAWKIGEIEQAEFAFLHMIDGSYQIPWREAWYHHRLGYFLMVNNRPDEALPHLSKAVNLGTYYGYPDTLSIFYSRLNKKIKANLLCDEALKLANQNQDILKCK